MFITTSPIVKFLLDNFDFHGPDFFVGDEVLISYDLSESDSCITLRGYLYSPSLNASGDAVFYLNSKNKE